MFNCCGAGWAVIGQLQVPWSAHWAVIGWCLLLAVPRLLGASCHLSSPRLRHTTQTVSGGHPDPDNTPQMLPILSTHRGKVEQLHTLLTMSDKINSVFCTMVLYNFWWIETFCWEDNFCQPSDLQNYMSVTSNVFKTSASFHNAQHWQLMKIKIKWKN